MHLQRGAVRVSNGEYSLLCSELVLPVFRGKSYNNNTHSLAHAHTVQPRGHMRNGPQMLSLWLSEEDILTAAWWSCQIFTETQQKK